MSLRIHGAVKISSSTYSGINANTGDGIDYGTSYFYDDFYTPDVGEAGWLKVRLDSTCDSFELLNTTLGTVLDSGPPANLHPYNYAYFIYNKTSSTNIDIVQVSGDASFYVYFIDWGGITEGDGWAPGPYVTLTNQSGTLRLGINPDGAYLGSNYVDPGPHTFTADEWDGDYEGDSGSRESANTFTGDVLDWKIIKTS